MWRYQGAWETLVFEQIVTSYDKLQVVVENNPGLLRFCFKLAPSSRPTTFITKTKRKLATYIRIPALQTVRLLLLWLFKCSLRCFLSSHWLSWLLLWLDLRDSNGMSSVNKKTSWYGPKFLQNGKVEPLPLPWSLSHSDSLVYHPLVLVVF